MTVPEEKEIMVHEGKFSIQALPLAMKGLLGLSYNEGFYLFLLLFILFLPGPI